MEKSEMETKRAEITLSEEIREQYNIGKHSLAYQLPKLGISTFQVSTPTANYFLKLVDFSRLALFDPAPENAKKITQIQRILKGVPLLALKCSQINWFPKIVSHKAPKESGLIEILMNCQGRPLADYIKNSENTRFKDLMRIFGQIVRAIIDLSKLKIQHFFLSLKSIFISSARNIVITEILPDITQFISYEEAISNQNEFQFPPEIWEGGALGPKKSSEQGHLYVLGSYFLKLLNSNPKIMAFMSDVLSEKPNVAAECTREQLVFVMELINRMVDIDPVARPTPHELLFYFKLFSLGNAGVAQQLMQATVKSTGHQLSFQPGGEIDFSNCAMNSRCLTELSDMLKAFVPVKGFDLSFNSFGNDGIIHLRDTLKDSALTLQSLNLRHVGLTDTGMKLLSTFIPFLKKLTILDLSFNPIRSIGCKHLAKGLTLKELQSLYLASIEAGTNGMKLLGSMIAELPTLHYLDMSSNNIGVSGARYVAESLSKLTELTFLSFQIKGGEWDYQKIQQTTFFNIQLFFNNFDLRKTSK